MSDNPLKIYKDYVRANLPTGMSYNTDVDRYQLNDHSFFKYVPANWYLRYISKYGYSAASAYYVNGFEPAYVTDFGAEFYRKSGATSTFSDSITHSASSNATMVDSDGLLKWRPHNLLLYSEQFDTWGKTNATVSANAAVAPNGTTTADVFEATSSGPDCFLSQVPAFIGPSTLSAFVKRVNSDWFAFSNTSFFAYFNIATGSVGTVGSGAASIVDAGNGWWLVSWTPTAGFGTIRLRNATANNNRAVSGGEQVLIWGAHLYRSDLGGMVNNPDRGDSYVPTTSQAVYLPRRGHHVYNGDTWVNKGLLHESEQRVNLLPYSTAWATWSQSGTAVVTGQTITDDSASSYEYRLQPVTISSGQKYVFWSDIEKDNDETRFPAIGLDLGTDSAWYQLNTKTGAVIQRSAIGSWEGGVVDMGGAWRVWLSGTSDSTSAIAYLFPADGTTFGVTSGTATGSATFLRSQLEAGSTPSSYIPTSGATVTRSAETLTVPAANLPWPSPVVIGEELVTNGTLDTDTDWTKGTGWTISGGVANHAAGTASSLEQASILTPGTVYQVTVDATASGGTWALQFFGGTTTTVGSSLVTGSYSLVGVAGPSNVTLRIFAGTSTDLTIDNISVKEINPLSVSIQMQGEATGDSYTPLRWYKDANNYITQNIGTSDFTFTQANAGVVDSVTGGSFTSGVNSAFNFASTHASTFVAAAVNGTSLTANTTPTALTDLSATDAQIGYDFNGTIQLVRVWADDITATGREEASTNA